MGLLRSPSLHLGVFMEYGPFSWWAIAAHVFALVANIGTDLGTFWAGVSQEFACAHNHREEVRQFTAEASADIEKL